VQYFNYLERRRRDVDQAAQRFESNLRRTHLVFPGIELPSPAFYILKLIQAAVALGAQTIRISVLDTELCLEADGCAFPDDFDLAACLMTFPALGSPLADLTIGLSGALESSNGQVDGLICGREQAQYANLTEHGIELRRENKGEWIGETTLAIRVHKNRPSLFSRLIGRHLGQRMDEHRVLYSRATLCPVDILLDGRKLTDFQPIHQLEGPTQLHGSRPQSGEFGFKIRAGDQTAVSSALQGTLGKVQGAVLTIGGAPQATEVYWVRRGVLLQRTTEKLTFGPKLAIVCADRLDLDLTQFGLLRNDTLEVKLQSLRTLITPSR
jgi:hypothetical protein